MTEATTHITCDWLLGSPLGRLALELYDCIQTRESGPGADPVKREVLHELLTMLAGQDCEALAAAQALGVSPQEAKALRHSARHEAAHVVTALVLGVRIASVTLDPPRMIFERPGYDSVSESAEEWDRSTRLLRSTAVAAAAGIAFDMDHHPDGWSMEQISQPDPDLSELEGAVEACHARGVRFTALSAIDTAGEILRRHSGIHERIACDLLMRRRLGPSDFEEYQARVDIEGVS